MQINNQWSSKGQSFTQTLVNQGPHYDNRCVMDKRLKFQRPNKKKIQPKYLK